MARQKRKQRHQQRSRPAERTKKKISGLRILLIVVGAMVLIGLAAAVFGVGRPSGGPDGVWSPEHGHWH
jgi:hypothetical protein